MTTPHTPTKLQFTDNGDANSFAILDDAGDWLMNLQLNGRDMTARQEANMRRLVACWNACNGVSTEALESKLGIYDAIEKLAAERDALTSELEVARVDTTIINWLERNHTMHRAVEAQYVVDGYEVGVTHDDYDIIAGPWHGATLREAYVKAMAAWDKTHGNVDLLKQNGVPS